MWAVLPVKAFDLAKQRLAAVINDQQRRQLAQAMFEDVVAGLKNTPEISTIIVVSADAQVLSLAHDLGLQTLVESETCVDLNGAVTEALAYVAAQGQSHAMVLHADLPLAKGTELSLLCQAYSPGSLAMVSDNQADGTNVLICPLPLSFDLAYGVNSFSAHQDAAKKSQIISEVFHYKSLALDIDRCEDLLILQGELINKQSYTSALLSGVEDFNALSHDLLEDTNFILSKTQALNLTLCDDAELLLSTASQLRDRGFGNTVTYSKKVFFPLTQLCRDVCHYCTFAQTPKFIAQAYMPVDEVVAEAQEAAKMGCKEALFTLGEKPELRYKTARDALHALGFSSTLEYVAHVAERVLTETGILPHINAGCMTADELAMLKPVSASMGIMLESASTRLCEKGMPHYGSPDKDPALRLQTLRLAGEADIPFTTGILIGIGETRLERIESLLAIRDIHQQYGHIQEIIVQNFRAKANTKMAFAPEPDLDELLWTIAVARWIFGADMSIQAPPNLSPGVLPQLVNAGINDWGGVSPITPDFVNPEAPWPQLKTLANETLAAGKYLHERITVYPRYLQDYERYLHANLIRHVLPLVDGSGLAREDTWLTGSSETLPENFSVKLPRGDVAVTAAIQAILDKSIAEQLLTEADIASLFTARGNDFVAVCQQADKLRQKAVGDTVTFAVNRNINYTNICYFKCTFCAFSKGKHSENLRGQPYDLAKDEIQRRTLEAWDRGASEVCMQGGIHPSYTGQTYIDICTAVKEAVPDMHIHAFSPLEVWQGAATLNLSLGAYLKRLKQAGLATLPGTAAEILHDDVREKLCSDKINSAQWLQVMEKAHKQGIRTTATIMFGHVDNYAHWARHIVLVRDLQIKTGGFTEFVPLPFVASGAPVFIRGQSRKGPTLRESILMHAVARIALFPHIRNIQASWVKLGQAGAQMALNAGANDVGGTLMNESITRAAGAEHGEELGIEKLEGMIGAIDRIPRLRNTLYGDVSAEREQLARQSGELTPIVLTAPTKSSAAVRLLKPGDSLDPRDLVEVI
ncbi:MAG: 5-amino-6-(D-ribitylamino)uracil--L-tyrosine 4-hydroxyphenyl transferase CofH [Pseudomonadales bacterium]|nr:5-amino-6-(D-ribitylamino)uracil--L-tyrosine 4-hydroxyphenyl transferase CofH [Pseudomonadales bacterium]